MRYRTKVILALLALVVVADGLVLWLAGRDASGLLFRQIQERVLSVATTAALLVDGDQHERIRTPADQGLPDYGQIEAVLRRIREANAAGDLPAAFIYTMRPDPAQPGRWRYVVDAQESGGAKSKVGDPVEFESTDTRGISLEVPRAESAFAKDQFGTWLSANAPIRDSAGRAVGVLGVDVDSRRVLAEQRRLLTAGAGALAVSLLVALLLALALTRWVTAPLGALRTAVESIARGELETRVAVRTQDEFGEVGTAVNVMAGALRERETLKGALARYVSHSVAENIIAANRLPMLRGDRRRITVLFCDIRDFTRFANVLPAEEVVTFLNEYFSEMIDVIFSEKGTLDKFLGDGLMAVFGAPLDDPQHEIHAVRAALEMQRRLAGMRERWREAGRAHIACGIGIHTGDAIVGNIGSEQRMEYTAIGDTVNIASRLEAETKTQECEILLSETTVAGLGEEFALRALGMVHCRGVAEPMAVFTLAAGPPA